jgi:DNA-binding helix-hairpin-helix protein with protein kinase domain
MYPHQTRTCPWCATARVIAFSEEGLVRALARHLETCPGEDSGGDA